MIIADLPEKTESNEYRKRKEPILSGGRKTQADKFREMAKKLEADESEEAFDEKLRRITKAPPESDKKKDKPAD